MTKYFGTPFASSGDKTAVPDALQPGGEVSYTEGWTADYEADQTTDPNAKDVDRQAENQLKFDITEALKEIQEHGFKIYDSLVNYPVDSYTVGSDGVIYKSLIANGPATSVVDPVGDVSGTWLPLPGVIATQAEAEAGADNTKGMTPLRVAQAIAALSAPDSFASQLLHVVDEKAQNTQGGSSIVGVNVRTLNTVRTNEISGASLGSNQITLPAGTYYIEGSAPSFQSNETILVLYNVTDAQTEVIGQSNWQSGSASGVSQSQVQGRFTIASSKVFELQHDIDSAQASNGLGVAANSHVAGAEVYASARIWKVS